MIIELLLLIQAYKEALKREKECFSYIKSENPLFKKFGHDRVTAQKELFNFIEKNDFPLYSLCDSYWKLALNDQLSCQDKEIYLDAKKEQEVIDRFMESDEVWTVIDYTLRDIADKVNRGE